MQLRTTVQHPFKKISIGICNVHICIYGLRRNKTSIYTHIYKYLNTFRLFDACKYRVINKHKM